MPAFMPGFSFVSQPQAHATFAGIDGGKRGKSKRRVANRRAKTARRRNRA